MCSWLYGVYWCLFEGPLKVSPEQKKTGKSHGLKNKMDANYQMLPLLF